MTPLQNKQYMVHLSGDEQNKFLAYYTGDEYFGIWTPYFDWHTTQRIMKMCNRRYNSGLDEQGFPLDWNIYFMEGQQDQQIFEVVDQHILWAEAPKENRYAIHPPKTVQINGETYWGLLRTLQWEWLDITDQKIEKILKNTMEKLHSELHINFPNASMYTSVEEDTKRALGANLEHYISEWIAQNEE